MIERKTLLLRLDPAVHDVLARWASDELRSTNAQIEFLLRRALAEAGWLPDSASLPPRRGRPPKLPEGHAMDTDGPAQDGDAAAMRPDVAHERTHRRPDARRSSAPLQEPHGTASR